VETVEPNVGQGTGEGEHSAPAGLGLMSRLRPDRDRRNCAVAERRTDEDVQDAGFQ
jgi:hypothetical protein